MIETLTVEEMYAHPGFDELMAEYATLSNPNMPPTASAAERKADYLTLEQAGILTVFCVAEGGKAVGFAVCMKNKLLHYGIFVALVESLYLMRNHRQNGQGNALIDSCEDFALMNGLWGYPFFQVHDEELERLGVVLKRRNYSAWFHTFGRSP